MTGLSRLQNTTNSWGGHVGDPFNFSIGQMTVMMKINDSLTCGSIPFSIGFMMRVICSHVENLRGMFYKIRLNPSILLALTSYCAYPCLRKSTGVLVV